jgi:hypothetical protein
MKQPTSVALSRHIVSLIFYGKIIYSFSALIWCYKVLILEIANARHVKNIPLGDGIFDTKILGSELWELLRRVAAHQHKIYHWTADKKRTNNMTEVMNRNKHALPPLFWIFQ